jgi:hypothetical protein
LLELSNEASRDAGLTDAHLIPASVLPTYTAVPKRRQAFQGEINQSFRPNLLAMFGEYNKAANMPPILPMFGLDRPNAQRSATSSSKDQQQHQSPPMKVSIIDL